MTALRRLTAGPLVYLLVSAGTFVSLAGVLGAGRKWTP